MSLWGKVLDQEIDGARRLTGQGRQGSEITSMKREPPSFVALLATLQSLRGKKEVLKIECWASYNYWEHLKGDQKRSKKIEKNLGFFIQLEPSYVTMAGGCG